MNTLFKYLFGMTILSTVYLSSYAQEKLSRSDDNVSQNEFIAVPSTTKINSDPTLLMLPTGNDNCASATTLTVGSAMLCGQDATGATLESNECSVDVAGCTESSMWYRFNATNDSLVLNYIQTNSTNCAPAITIAGPYAIGGGCYPSAPCGCSTPPWYDFGNGTYQGTGGTCYLLSNGDPGNHMLLTGLSVGSDYLVRFQNESGGGANSRWATFCISLANPAPNAFLGSASSIDQCGTNFSGATNGGYWNNGTAAGFNNIDNNANTTCGGCTAGDDLAYIINNISYFKFCATANGTWQLTLSGIGGCTLPAPNAGVQSAIFVGTPTNLTWIESSPTGTCGASGNGQLPPGCSWTSSVFTVNAGQCAYIAVDGFAGDGCNYSVSLTNVSGGCTVALPIKLLSFTAECKDDNVVANWETETEINNDYFTLEKSKDGTAFYPVAKVKAAGNSITNKKYSVTDYELYKGTSYYRLKQTDFNGQSETLSVIAIDACGNNDFTVYQNPTSGIFTIQSNEKKYELIISNALGAKIYSSKIIHDKSEIDLSSRPNGIYFISIKTEHGTANKKLIIQK